jgi:hypothetical protein
LQPAAGVHRDVGQHIANAKKLRPDRETPDRKNLMEKGACNSMTAL